MPENAPALGQSSLVGRSPFVGRERELAWLSETLKEVAAGDGGVVLISGEPGIGKTRLLKEVADRAAARGWLVLGGRAYECEGMPPYLPVIEALRQYLKVCPPSDLRAQLGRGAPEVAILVPELIERVPDIKPNPPLSQDERYRSFEAVAGFLLSAANAHQPGVLLAIDDFHWADQGTLLLFRHLARRLAEAPLLVAATCRTSETDRPRPFTDILADLHRERLCRQIDLGPLSSDEAGQLIWQLAGVAPSPRVVASVHSRTGGNPFFLEETIRHLATQGRDLSDEGSLSADWGVPETVRQVIGQRLARLQPETLRTLQVASALGDPFSIDALAAAAGSELAPLVDALDEASAAGFVGAESSNTYQFGHALVRETLYAGLSAPRRAFLHAEVAAKLEALHRASSDAHVGELAHHFLLGGRREDLGKAVAYALQAAERATVQMAFEEAVPYYQMALDAQKRSDERDESRRCETLLAFANAVFKAGDQDRANELRLTAAEAARSAGLPELLARACLATASAQPHPNSRLIPLIEHALAATSPIDSSLRSGLLSVLAWQRAITESWEESTPVREESIAMARRLGNGRALAFALRNAYLEWNLNRVEQRVEAIEEVIELARGLGDREIEISAQCHRLQVALGLGDIEGVDAGIEIHARLGDELQQRRQMTHLLILRSMRALMAGPLPLAEQLDSERESVERRDNLRHPTVARFHLVLRWEQGRLAELRPAYQAALHGRDTPLRRAELAFICAELGDATAAHALIEQLGVDGFGAIPFDLDWAFAMSLLAQACSAIGDAPHAGSLYQLLLPFARFVVSVNAASVSLGSTCRYLGLLATALGRFDDAEGHFDQSDAMNARLGARPMLAHTSVDRARLCMARRSAGDAASARELLVRAADAFDGLEMPHHAEVARWLLESQRLGAPPRAVHPAGLSEREFEVLRLLAEGRTNQQIGAELFISLNTVARHVSNIFDKTGAANRTEAAAYATRHGLVR